MKEIKQTRMGNKEIRVWSIVTENIGEFDNKNREGWKRIMIKELMGCVQADVGKKKFQFHLKYGKIYIYGFWLDFLVCSKEKYDQGVNETISGLRKK